MKLPDSLPEDVLQGILACTLKVGLLVTCGLLLKTLTGVAKEGGGVVLTDETTRFIAGGCLAGNPCLHPQSRVAGHLWPSPENTDGCCKRRGGVVLIATSVMPSGTHACRKIQEGRDFSLGAAGIPRYYRRLNS